jgi:chemotaxis protein CheY-P-specific phosphatase CheC
MDTIGRCHIVEAMTGMSANSDDELADSVLQEMGNIFGTAVANRLAEALDASVKTTAPEVVTDLAGAIASTVIGRVGDVGDDVLLLQVALERNTIQMNCGFYLFFDDRLKTILCTSENTDEKFFKRVGGFAHVKNTDS